MDLAASMHADLTPPAQSLRTSPWYPLTGSALASKYRQLVFRAGPAELWVVSTRS